jgi:hypothetical protein
MAGLLSLIWGLLASGVVLKALLIAFLFNNKRLIAVYKKGDWR